MKRPRRAPVVSGQERAGLYKRVSLDRAAHGLQDEILSPETQEDRARAYCRAQDWPVAIVTEDIDESGYRQHYSHRPGLMRLIAAVERGELTKIVVYKFSRLSRRLKEFIELCDRIEAAGAGLVSVTEQSDTSTPSGRLIRNILASFAQFQSEEISEQIFETWMTKAKRGERPGGRAPFGTRNRKGILEVDPATYPTLVTIFETFRATESIRAVWDYLTAAGVPAPRAGAWNLNTIRGILSNPVYMGRLEWAGAVFQGKWEPLLPEVLWADVQALIGGRKSVPTGRRDARMLTGFLICGGCDRPMWTRYAKRSSAGHAHLRRVYWCCSPATQRRGCDVPAVDGEEVEAALWPAVILLLRAAGTDALVTAALRKRVSSRRSGAVDPVLGQRGPADPVLVERAAAAAPGAATRDERRQILSALALRVVATPTSVELCIGGELRISLHGRRIGQTWHFGGEYHRLDFAGSALTDKQAAFLLRTYDRADRHLVAKHLGRSYAALIQAARRLRRAGMTESARRGSQAGSP